MSTGHADNTHGAGPVNKPLHVNRTCRSHTQRRISSQAFACQHDMQIAHIAQDQCTSLEWQICTQHRTSAQALMGQYAQSVGQMQTQLRTCLCTCHEAPMYTQHKTNAHAAQDLCTSCKGPICTQRRTNADTAQDLCVHMPCSTNVHTAQDKCTHRAGPVHSTA